MAAGYSIPLGARSIWYLTRLLKPQLDEQKFEESFATWEFQLSRYERDNNTLLPDAVKIAILLNETKGPLQQHLQLQAGNIATYAQIRSMVIECYRATASFTRLQAIASSNNNQGPAPMDIGATWYNKERQAQGQRKAQQRQRLWRLRQQLQLQQLQRRKRQVQSTTGWTRKPVERTTRIWQRKGIQQQRKRQRILQQPTRRKRSKRKTRNKCLLQMRTTRTHGQTMRHRNLRQRLVSAGSVTHAPTGATTATTGSRSISSTHLRII